MNDNNIYKLILVLKNNNKNEPFVLTEYTNLKDLDSFTMCFNSFKEMTEELNNAHNTNLNVIGGYIEINNKQLDILFNKDKFDEEKVISTYREYILSNSNYYNKSPMRFTKIDNINNSIYAYFKDRNYKKIRDTYIELKSLGLESKVLINNKGRTR